MTMGPEVMMFVRMGCDYLLAPAALYFLTMAIAMEGSFWRSIIICTFVVAIPTFIIETFVIPAMIIKGVHLPLDQMMILLAKIFYVPILVILPLVLIFGMRIGIIHAVIITVMWISFHGIMTGTLYYQEYQETKKSTEELDKSMEKLDELNKQLEADRARFEREHPVPAQ